MPWSWKSFKKHNPRLSQPKLKEAAKVANRVLKESGDEGKAIRVANAVVRHGKTTHPKPR